MCTRRGSRIAPGQHLASVQLRAQGLDGLHCGLQAQQPSQRCSTSRELRRGQGRSGKDACLQLGLFVGKGAGQLVIALDRAGQRDREAGLIIPEGCHLRWRLASARTARAHS